MRAAFGCLVLAAVAVWPAYVAQAMPAEPPSLLGELRWRMIGPFRGGRTVGAVGVPSQPGVFYIGVNNGGVWKTDDYGRTWNPIFDAQPTGSIGAVTVAPSDPNIIYVGSGEGLQRPDLSVGDGIYRSQDGGRTWQHLGLRDGQQIPAVAVDPKNPRHVFAAVLGHPYGANAERGVFRSTDGGETWTHVLFVDEDTGATDVLFDPGNPRTLFAVLWAARQSPWEGAGFGTLSTHNGLYKSTDGGVHWRHITSGLPSAAQGLGRMGIAIAASRPRRMYAVLGAREGAGLYRSDDAGEHWAPINTDPRLCERDGDFNEVKADPKNPDILYVANVAAWKSVDGGKTFTGWRGAPGGDDYHRIWIDPVRTDVLLMAGDQGAVITVNGGRTWSSWYNQPTAQFYHVSTDNQFPYRVYGGQQESGSAGVLSRSDDGQITFRDWRPVGAEEYGYVAADPLHPNIVYGGKLNRFDFATGDVQNVSPDPIRSGQYRWVRTMPVLFSPLDPRLLYLAANVLFTTVDGGTNWSTISPDLTRERYDTPASVGVFRDLDPEKGLHRGVIYTVAPSPLRKNLIWAGTDDGLIHVTHDGGAHWQNVTPPDLTPWSKVSLLDASHFDSLAAYAAVNRFRLDDVRPHVYRTRDGGKTWSEIVRGIPADEVVNAVREDPVRPGLLFAATERTVHVSFDDGDNWQSLRLNLPATAVRDLVVHDVDLVIGTHGRSFWILDDIAPLRQIDAARAASGAFLYQPSRATRVRWNRNTDTPLPPDEPAGQNPPDGAILDYRLARDATGPVTLEILNHSREVVRRFSSTDAPDSLIAGRNVPDYWIRRPRILPAAAGAHRFVWDLHAPAPATARFEYPIAAIANDTPREPRGPWVLPGTYTVRLQVDGQSQEQPLEVRMDPRVATPHEALVRQFELSAQLARGMRRDSLALAQVRALRARLKARRTSSPGDSTAVDSLDQHAARLETGAGAPPAKPGEPGPANLARLQSGLARLYDVLQESDAAPTTAHIATAARLQQSLLDLEGQVRTLLDRPVPGAP